MTYRVEAVSLQESPDLFNDYLNSFDKIAEFFSWDPRYDVRTCIEARLQNYRNRDKVVEILKRQQMKWEASTATLENLEKLSRPDTLAVVTGQQAGLYGGPLYTVYKILTVVKKSALLSKTNPDYSFVPLFWLEAGDSDYREVNHFQVLDTENQLVRLELPARPDDHHSVYRRSVPAEIKDIQQQLEKIFVSNDFRDDVLNRLKNIYQAGENFAEAFARWVHAFLGEFGIIVINPTDPAFGHLSKPLFSRALQEWKEIRDRLDTVNDQLIKKGFHTQILLDEQQTTLFFEDDQGSRARVDGEGESFIVKSPDALLKFGRHELLDVLEKSPQRFTPNVALRPVLQDWLLPTAIYIGGPSEISYAAQLKPLYDFLGVVEPVFQPRIRLSLVEKKIQKAVEKLQLDYEDIFREGENLIQKHVRKRSDRMLVSTFEEAEKQLKESMEKIGSQLQQLDPTLQGSVDKTANHLKETVLKLREKADEAMQRKMQADISQFEKVLSNLLPQGKFQERVLNLIQYQVKYGPHFIRELYNSLDMEQNQHQMVFL